MTPRRLFAASLFAVSSALLIGGCSADGPVAAAPAAQPATAAALAVDPAIPALTIVAHRMNETEKKAYDRDAQTTVAAVQP